MYMLPYIYIYIYVYTQMQLNSLECNALFPRVGSRSIGCSLWGVQWKGGAVYNNTQM